jgi:hypothetical protein
MRIVAIDAEGIRVQTIFTLPEILAAKHSCIIMHFTKYS